jgi:hypothetical protein
MAKAPSGRELVPVPGKDPGRDRQNIRILKMWSLMQQIIRLHLHIVVQEGNQRIDGMGKSQVAGGREASIPGGGDQADPGEFSRKKVPGLIFTSIIDNQDLGLESTTLPVVLGSPAHRGQSLAQQVESVPGRDDDAYVHGHDPAPASLREKRGRLGEDVGNRGRVFSICRCMVILFAEKPGINGPVPTLSRQIRFYGAIS